MQGGVLAPALQERRKLYGFLQSTHRLRYGTRHEPTRHECLCCHDRRQKQAIMNKAHNVRSEREMQDLVASLARPTM